MKKQLTVAEIERRFAEIDAKEPEQLTAEEAANLANAEAMDDGTTMTLEEFKKSL